jgi:hypothetical protein
LKNYPAWNSENAFLFVQSNQPHLPVKTSTLSGWLSRSVQVSLKATGILSKGWGYCVGSLAWDMALRKGVSIQDIVLIGNWSSFSVFDNH